MSSVKEIARLVRSGNGEWFFDFGKDAFGRLILELTAGRNTVVEIALGECLKEGRIDPSPGGFRRYFKTAVEVKAGKHSVEILFPPHQAPNAGLKKCLPPEGVEIMPFRYVEISGSNISSVQPCRLAYYGGFNDEAAEFVSSSAALNEVWEFCKYSIKATNAFECYIDGDRERLPYEGDTYINQLGHFCCDADYGKAANTICRLLTAPTWPIEWRLLMPVIVRDYVLYSGDTSQLARWKSALTECLFMERCDADALLPEKFDYMKNGENVRTIVDWPPVERDGCEFVSAMTVPNCCLYEALRAMHWLYGDEKYLENAGILRASIRRKMMKNGIFTDGTGSEHSALHSLVFPVAFGVADQTDWAKLGGVIKAKGMACSVYAAQYVLDASFICGLHEHALHLLTRRGERSWLGMIDQGSTITMEAWSNELKPNQDWNHAWGAAPANVIPRRLCGIRPVRAGFAEFIVEPKPGDLEFFRFRQPTLHGAVTVEYRKNSGTTVTLPDGTQKSFSGESQIFKMR